jgi:hypothetical protein
MIKLIKYLKQFSLCQRGVAITEFAVVAPLFVILLVGMVEITNYVFSFNKAEQAAATLANIIARNKITEAQLDSLMVAVNPLMEPFDFNGPGNGVFVSAFGVDPDTEEPEILWTRTYKTPGPGITPEQLADRITLDPDRDETVITVQVFYKFTPMMTSFLFDGGAVDVNTFSIALPRDDPMKELDN